tara:strand:- start:647 stop:1678 length:1032 start_codon:yes stop_codon:yes gene_type:complete
MNSQGTKLLQKVLEKNDLTEEESYSILEDMASGDLQPALSGALLVALRSKGEVAAEILGFARAMRTLAINPSIPSGENYVDIVGTGGDGSGSLNLSTGSALLAAACGVKVLKHGNRSVSSRSGSADVLKALGLPVPMSEKQVIDCLTKLGFTFLFAPSYHPAMKNIAPVRQALGVRTMFNILGPLANPACPPFHVIGAYDETMAELMANTLSGLDTQRGFVVHGAPGWDEPTPAGPFLCFDVRPGSVTKTIRDPADYGLARCTASDLMGGTPEENAKRLHNALCNRDSTAHREALILGAALALEVTGAVPDPESGAQLAKEVLNDGHGEKFIEKLVSFNGRSM